MRAITKWILILVCIVSALAMHLFVSYALPLPLSKANTILSLLSIILLYTHSGKVVWLSFILHYFIDLYTQTPFGIVLVTGTFAILFVYWTGGQLFSNASVWVAATLAAFTVVVYRVLYVSIVFLVSLVYTDISTTVGYVTHLFLWELCMTVLITVVIYWLATAILRKIKKHVIW